MTRKELRESVERYLQGKRNERWSDSEINTYLNEAQLEFCRLSKIPETESSTLQIPPIPNPVSATLSASGRVATIAEESHGLSVGDSVLVSESTNTYCDGGHLVTVVTDDTFEYLLPENTSQTVASESVNYVATGPIFTKPATILEITSVTLDGRELAIYTQSDLDRAANSGSGGVRMVQTALGATPSPFYTINSSYYPKKWRDSQGKLEAVVISERSASSFRVFPLPSEPEHVYLDKDAATKVSQGFIIRGVLNPTKMTLDTETPQIPESFHEALVYGALDRAYLKESQLRNVDKSNMFRGRFLSLVGEAQRNEGLNSGSIGGGRNELRIRVAR
tara:strand:+ start:1117 stop:2121 length:1005 start_codon:yes stop_codon:yes gene_type:complete